jgi:hypothetical protein
MSTSEAKFDADRQSVVRDGFKDWMERDEVRALLSLLPSSAGTPVPELLETVLRSAFKAGFSNGMSYVAFEMTARMMESDRGRSSR